MLTGNVEYHLRFCLHLSDAKQGILYDFSSSMTHQVLKYIATLRCCVSEKREMQNMLTYTFTYTQIIDTRLCSKINNKQSTNVFSLKSTPNRLHPFAVLMDSGRNSIMNLKQVFKLYSQRNTDKCAKNKCLPKEYEHNAPSKYRVLTSLVLTVYIKC